MAFSSADAEFAAARKNMIFGQLVPRGICESGILDAVGSVPRELFLPERMRPLAYADRTLAVDAASFLFEPAIFARLLQLADIRESDFVLDLKAGTGYSAAVIAKKALAVVAVESDALLCRIAEDNFIKLSIDNAAALNMDERLGFQKQAPFDLVFIDGIISSVPEGILAQIADKGRLVCVIAQTSDAAAKAFKITKLSGSLSYTPAFEIGLKSLNLPKNSYNFAFEPVS